MKISASVGVNSPNKKKDVGVIQALLNRYVDAGKLPGAKHLGIDGDWGPNSKTAFAMFELIFMGWAVGKVTPGSERLKKLNEMSYAGIESLLKKFNDEPEPATDEWAEAYDDSKTDAVYWIPDAAKTWARIEPTDDIEAELFTSKDANYPGVIVWKTKEPQRFSTTNRWKRLQIYELKPEAMSFWENRGATDGEARVLAGAFKMWNNAVYYYVVEKHYSPSDAFTRIRVESTEDLVEVFQLLSMLPSGPISMAKLRPTIPKDASKMDLLLKALNDNAGKMKTARSRWEQIKKKYFNSGEE